MVDLAAVLDDLEAEGAALDRLVGDLGPELWAAETPAPGWTIAHQIAHLAWTDDQVRSAATDPAAFAAALEDAAADPDGFVDRAAVRGAALPPERILARWRTGRAAVSAVLAAVPAGQRLPWYGPPMSVASMAGARIMETWAHGQDIADTLGVVRPLTDRLRYVARIGVRARDYAYAVHGLRPPEREFRVELTGPAEVGGPWTHGPQDAAERVSGPLLDFCLLVTRRRHADDLAIRAHGAEAARWLGITQSYAGPPGQGRTPGQFA
ncbi:TIGR03084 family metal-binding protein [Embleya sp. NBC_00896]|uniref:TIGR03084 family metal-binding protein n=1 Tax=Embleya sp. NBC_00896 TaxID=2975961 RepID=UPI002F90FD4D|nr:TIGR03084 family metal-binding protein [Embleya sp. NBC_00896]